MMEKKLLFRSGDAVIRATCPVSDCGNVTLVDSSTDVPNLCPRCQFRASEEAFGCVYRLARVLREIEQQESHMHIRLEFTLPVST